MTKKVMAKPPGKQAKGKQKKDPNPPAASPVAAESSAMKPEPWTAPVIDADALRQSPGAQEGIARYCEQSFTTPEFTAISSEALVNAFSVNLIWLADLIQPPQLVAELRQSCCYLTSRIIMYWIKQGQTHKLARLADAIQEAAPPLSGPEAGRIMVLLAGMLGVLRPERARRLQELGQPLLNETQNTDLIQDAILWVKAGEQLSSCSSAERILWNQRLRQPEEEWEWDSSEARQALQSLALIIQAKEDDYSVFREIIPGCWWDLAIATGEAKRQARDAQNEMSIAEWIRGEGFGRGIFTGVAMAVALIAISLIAEATGLLRVISNTVTAVPSLFSGSSEPDVEANRPPQDRPRFNLLKEMFAKSPNVQRLHEMLKTGKFMDNRDLIYGKTSLAPAGSPDHSALLSSLLLDPPGDPEVRRAVEKLVVRVGNPAELYPVLEATIYPGSVNYESVKEIAQLWTELNQAQLTDEYSERFKALSTK